MGRPDMAYFGFTNKYFNGEPIKIFNNGDFENDMYRDFTYIDDIIEGIVRLLSNPPCGELGIPADSGVAAAEGVPATYASTDLLQEAVGFKPETTIEDGLQKFADWYVEYYGVK